LYRDEGCSSLFTYCTQILHLSEHAAYGRAERGLLEFHHVVPHADGGEASVQNLQLRCRAHNALEAERHFGPLFARERGAACDSVRTG
jgi:hypothetical protein